MSFAAFLRSARLAFSLSGFLAVEQRVGEQRVADELGHLGDERADAVAGRPRHDRAPDRLLVRVVVRGDSVPADVELSRGGEQRIGRILRGRDANDRRRAGPAARGRGVDGRDHGQREHGEREGAGHAVSSLGDESREGGSRNEHEAEGVKNRARIHSPLHHRRYSQSLTGVAAVGG